MNYQLTTIDPPEILTESPVEGFPLRRSVGDPASWSAPEGCRYLPVIERERPEHDPQTQRLNRLPDAIVGEAIHTHRREVIDLTSEEIAERSRKIWPSVQEFYAEFSGLERYAIQSTTDPAVVVARGDLAMWRGEIHSDDERVIAGLAALVGDGIITGSRRDSIISI